MRSRAARTSWKVGGSGGRRGLQRRRAARVVMAREPLEQVAQRGALVGVERAEELALDALRHLPQAGELPLAVVGDADDVAAAVLRVALPGHVPAPLQRV